MTDIQLFAVPAAGPDMDVVAELERLLAEAVDGRVRAIAVVYDTGPDVCEVIVGRYDNFEMLGMVYRLAHRMQIDMDVKAQEES